jgi:hypothetical protein
MDTGEAILMELREQTKLLKILVEREATTVAGREETQFATIHAAMSGHHIAISDAYREYINPRANKALTRKGKDKVDDRLKRYTVEELIIAIFNFSTDEWNMKNNRHRGLAWFMNGDDRIEEFLNLDLKTVAEAAEKAHACPKCGSDKYGFRGTVFQCDSCGHTRVGNQKDADKRHQDLGNGMGMLPAGGRVAHGRLAEAEPQPQRRLVAPAESGYDEAGSGALPSAVQRLGPSARNFHDAEAGR